MCVLYAKFAPAELSSLKSQMLFVCLSLYFYRDANISKFKAHVKEHQSVQIKQRKNSIFTDTHQKINLHLDIRPSAQVLR